MFKMCGDIIFILYIWSSTIKYSLKQENNVFLIGLFTIYFIWNIYFFFQNILLKWIKLKKFKWIFNQSSYFFVKIWMMCKTWEFFFNWSFFFPFGHSVKIIIIIEVDFLKNICNKKHNKYIFNHHPTCIMSNEVIGWQR